MASYRINCYRCNNQFFSEFHLTSLCSICHNAEAQSRMNNSYGSGTSGGSDGLEFYQIYMIAVVLSFILWFIGSAGQLPMIQLAGSWCMKIVLFPFCLFFASIFGLVSLDINLFVEAIMTYLTF